MIFLSTLLAFAGDPIQDLAQSQKALQDRNYDRSSELLNHMLREHNGTPQAIEAKILLADLYFQKTEWPTAKMYYQQFLNEHPSHEKAPKALYRIGMTLYKDAPKNAERDQRSTHAAITSWTTFLYKYPNSSYRKEVEEKLKECNERLAQKELEVARFYARRQKWEAVRRRTDFLLQKYPSSVLVPQGLFLSTLALTFLEDNDRAAERKELLSKSSPELIPKLEMRIQKGK